MVGTSRRSCWKANSGRNGEPECKYLSGGAVQHRSSQCFVVFVPKRVSSRLRRQKRHRLSAVDQPGSLVQVCFLLLMPHCDEFICRISFGINAEKLNGLKKRRIRSNSYSAELVLLNK